MDSPKITPPAFLECVPYDSQHQKVSFLIETSNIHILDDLKDIPIDKFQNILETSIQIRTLVDSIFQHENDTNTNNRIDEERNKCKEEYNTKVKQLKDDHEKKLKEMAKEYTSNVNSYSEDLENHKRSLEELKREHEKRMAILQKEKDGLKQEKSTLLTTLQEKEEAMNIFKKQMDELFQKSLEPIKNNHKEELLRMDKHYKEEKARMEHSSSSEILRLETAHKEMRVLLERNHITENERLKKKLEEQEERIQHLYSELKQSQASVIKGSVGQADFLELVKQHTDWTNMEDTSKTARAGDLKGFIGKVETMFEVKNYTSDVPGKEVTKFIRDMEVHSNIPYGVFVSMTSGIANKKGDVSFQWTSHGQLCIFFGNFLKHDMEMSLKYIGECSGIGHRFFTLSQGEENNEAEIYRDKLIQVKTIITKQLSDVSEMNASMMQHKKLHLDNINKHYTEYKMGMDKMKVLCNEIIDIIVGESMESTIENEVVEENMVEGKKKRGRKTKGESSATASL